MLPIWCVGFVIKGHKRESFRVFNSEVEAELYGRALSGAIVCDLIAVWEL